MLRLVEALILAHHLTAQVFFLHVVLVLDKLKLALYDVPVEMISFQLLALFLDGLQQLVFGDQELL